MKTYTVKFGTGNPTLLTGLTPTLTLFARADTGATLAAPSFTEAVAGWGIYQFQWGTTTPIIFLADGFTSGLGANRYISGQLDPSDRSDEYGTSLVAVSSSLVALGTTNVALGTTNVALGTTNVALGTTNVALGTTNVALGTSIYALDQTLLLGISIIGDTTSLIGDDVTDPTTLFGYLKRALEVNEGQQNFTKAAGSWTILDRTGATTLRTRTVTNSASTVIRS